MGIKIFNQTSDGRRGKTGYDFYEITKTEQEKALTMKLKRSSARNNYGRITMRHQGGGSKKLYRIIDFERNKLDVDAKVAAIEYDPYRTSLISHNDDIE